MRARRWIVRLAACLAGLPLAAVLALWAAANTSSGRQWVAAVVERASGGAVVIQGLSGRLPDALHVDRFFLSDSQGRWLTAEGLELNWSPIRLVTGTAQVNLLVAERLTVTRRPVQEEETPPSEEETSLPVAIQVQTLAVRRLELAPGLAGNSARVFRVQAMLQLASLDRGRAEASILDLEGQDYYRLQARMDPATVQGELRVRERPQGLIASLAGLGGIGHLAIDARLQGPREAAGARMDVAAGPARLQMGGTLNLMQGAADLNLSVTAPAMQPAAGVSWQELSLEASLRGPFRSVTASGHLALRGLLAATTAVREVALDWRGDAGRLHLDGSLEGVRLPVARPEPVEKSPVSVAADADFGASKLEFVLQHALLAAEGRFTGMGPVTGQVNLRLPDLGPVADLGGLNLKGRSELRCGIDWRDGDLRLTADGRISIPSGEGPLPALVGDAGNLEAAVKLKGNDFSLDRFRLRGKALQAEAAGGLNQDVLDLGWKLGLSDLNALSDALSGRLSAQGQVKGPLRSFAAELEANAEFAVRGLPKGHLSLKLEGSGLPAQPSAALKADGMLAGAPLQLAARLQSAAAGGWRLSLEGARWKSARAGGELLMPKGAVFPVGNLDLRMGRLADLDPLLGMPLAGSVSAALAASEAGGRQQARLVAEGRDLVLAGAASGRQLRVDLNVADPLRHPDLNGILSLEGWTWQEAVADARLEASGPLEALDLGLRGDAHQLAGGDLSLHSQGRLDLPGSTLALMDLETVWKKETLRLLQPVRIRFGEGLSLDRLRLGLGDAELEVRGRIAPALDLNGSLRRLPTGLARLFQPELDLEGHIQADVRLSGAVSAPWGSASLGVEGLRARSGPGRGLPPARLQASVRLDGSHASLDAKAAAGQTLSMSVTGLAPLNERGLFDLRGNGLLDLRMLEPILAVHGQRARGRLTLDAALTGSFAEPGVNGRLALDQGEWQDYVQGMHLLGLSGLVQAEGGTLRLVRLQGRAGTGTLSAQGALATAGAGLPLELSVTARKATLLSSERLEVNLDADLTFGGRLREELSAAGKLRINRAEIRIPERMPATIAVLKVRELGVPPPPPPEPGPDLALDLTVAAPAAVFVRGRGLDAELAGKVRLRGTLQDLRPEGGFFMRRGQFSLAGQTLTFSKGVVGFEGGRITDPSLNFVAETGSGDVTAKLEVTGSARKPKIGLSSVPDLPQDEVLAQLLYGRGSSSLSPFEMVQIASALSSLAGLTPGGSDPLGGVREGLGLDRLSLGGGGKSPTLEGGRYVAPGIYVGAKQGVALNSTQGMVQIDVARGLKLEAGVGTGSATGSTSGTSSVGVIYQFEY